MKKILTVLFVFMLMVGSAIGGYFISENGLISTKNKSVTENQVVQKIDKFCNSAGWGEATTLHEKSKDKLSSISLLDSQNVTDYDKEQVDFEGRENMIKSFLYIAKYTLLTEGIKDGEFYISSSSSSCFSYCSKYSFSASNKPVRKLLLFLISLSVNPNASNVSSISLVIIYS